VNNNYIEFRNIDERVFFVPSTPNMIENIKIHHIFYVTESLHSLCLGNVFRFSLTLKSWKVCREYSSTIQCRTYSLPDHNQCHILQVVLCCMICLHLCNYCIKNM